MGSFERLRPPCYIDIKPCWQLPRADMDYMLHGALYRALMGPV